MEYSESDQAVGFYGYDNERKSDASGDDSLKHSKKDTLKRKEKEAKKEKKQAYATLEGESSPDELDSKSPLKSSNKKNKSFKFTKTKEKREKSREKEPKKDKPKEKVKEKKKKDVWDEYPIFGVNLDLATERSRCHDGVTLPLPLRETIQFIHQHTNTENLYKLNSVKSKVQHIKHQYNNREPVCHEDVATAVGLLKLFIRELPSPILTNELLPKFEDCTSVVSISTFVTKIQQCVTMLPQCNRVAFAWLIVHLHEVSLNERENKMSIAVLSNTLNSVLLISHKLLSLLIANAKFIFPTTHIQRYVGPMTCNEITSLNDRAQIEIELNKQESLIEQIHYDMNIGCVTKLREEQLWEVQRIITQLKRKLRLFHKDSLSHGDNTSEFSLTSVDDTKRNADDDEKEKQREESEEQAGKAHESNDDVTVNESIEIERQVERQVEKQVEIKVEKQVEKQIEKQVEKQIERQVERPSEKLEESTDVASTESLDELIERASRPCYSSLLSEEDEKLLIVQFQNSELIELQTNLLGQIKAEKTEVMLLREKLRVRDECNAVRDVHGDESDEDEDIDVSIDALCKENELLATKKNELIRELMLERGKCVVLQSQLMYAAFQLY